MFTHPYSIYIRQTSLYGVAFLVDSSLDSIETVDQIIGYNRGLWGGRYNPIILTDGRTLLKIIGGNFCAMLILMLSNL